MLYKSATTTIRADKRIRWWSGANLDVVGVYRASRLERTHHLKLLTTPKRHPMKPLDMPARNPPRHVMSRSGRGGVPGMNPRRALGDLRSHHALSASYFYLFKTTPIHCPILGGVYVFRRTYQGLGPPVYQRLSMRDKLFHKMMQSVTPAIVFETGHH